MIATETESPAGVSAGFVEGAGLISPFRSSRLLSANHSALSRGPVTTRSRASHPRRSPSRAPGPIELVRATGERVHATTLANLDQLPQPPVADGLPPGLHDRTDTRQHAPRVHTEPPHAASTTPAADPARVSRET